MELKKYIEKNHLVKVIDNEQWGEFSHDDELYVIGTCSSCKWWMRDGKMEDITHGYDISICHKRTGEWKKDDGCIQWEKKCKDSMPSDNLNEE